MGQQRVNPDISKVYLTTAPGGPFMAPGTKFTYQHPTYGEIECRFVQVKSGTADVALASGDVLHWKDAEGSKNGIVTSDQSDVGTLNNVAGICLTTVTAAQVTAGTALISIMVRGYHAAVKVNTSTVEGDCMIASTTDLTCGRTAKDTAPTNQIIGWALAADTAGVGPVQVTLE
jgi:hypothetical protein